MTPDPGREAVAQELPARPRLALDVRVHPPQDEGGPWVLDRRGSQYFRVGPDIARLAQVLTGDYDQTELLDVLGERWDRDGLARGLGTLQRMRLLDDGRPAARTRWIAVVPPMSVQFSILDPSRLLPPLVPLARWLALPAAQVLSACLVVGGAVALALSAGEIRTLLATPVEADVLLVLVLGGFVGIVVHEFAHGVTLARHGGEPRRMGFMLLYLLPAFFCDVSDGWRLPRRGQRVQVALAGVHAQLVVAAACAVAGLAVPASPWRDALLLLAVITYVAALVNVLPVLKFDGYLALMSWLDVPNLRHRATADARAWLARHLHGARTGPQMPGRWVVPFGLACLLAPFVLVGGVVLPLWSGAVQGTGVVGALLVLAIAAGVVLVAAREVVRVHALSLAGHAPRARIVVVDAAAALLLAGVLATVPVPHVVPGQWQVGEDGPRLLIPTTAAGDVGPGDRVELRTNGLVFREQVGTATVAAAATRTEAVPLSQVLPVDLGDGLDLDYRAFALDVDGPGPAGAGVARVHTGERPLAAWLWTRYGAPVVGSW